MSDGPSPKALRAALLKSVTFDEPPRILATDRLALAEALGLVDERGRPTEWFSTKVHRTQGNRNTVSQSIAAIIAGPEEAE